MRGRKAKEKRQAEAAKRQAARDSLTNEQQLMLLDERPGFAARERERLFATPDMSGGKRDKRRAALQELTRESEDVPGGYR